jgi:hypothetical protein
MLYRISLDIVIIIIIVIFIGPEVPERLLKDCSSWNIG